MFSVTGLCPKSLAIAGSAVTMMFASTLSMNNAQATMSGARKTGDMSRARGKDAIMPTMWLLRHVRQRLFRMLQQSFQLPCPAKETTAAHDVTDDARVRPRQRNLRAMRVSCDSRNSSATYNDAHRSTAIETSARANETP